jgi:hypothetical protein
VVFLKDSFACLARKLRGDASQLKIEKDEEWIVIGGVNLPIRTLTAQGEIPDQEIEALLGFISRNLT